MTSVDTIITQWRVDWSSASVVNHTIVTDPILSDSQVSISIVIHGLWCDPFPDRSKPIPC